MSGSNPARLILEQAAFAAEETMRQTTESQGAEDLRKGGLTKLLARPVSLKARPTLQIHDETVTAPAWGAEELERMAERFRNALPAVQAFSQEIRATFVEADWEEPKPQASAPKTAFPRECFGCNRVMLLNEGATHCPSCRADDVIRQLDSKSYAQRQKEITRLEKWQRQEKEKAEALSAPGGYRRGRR